MTIELDKLMNSFRDYDASMEPKKVNEDAKVRAFNKKKKWLVDAIDQHISYIGNDKHKIKIDGVFVPVGKAEDKAIKEFSAAKELIIDGEKKRCLVLKLRFKGSPNHIMLKNTNISTLPLPNGASEDVVNKTRKMVMEKIREDIVSGKYDGQISKFGSKAKKAEDEDKPGV